FGATQFTDGASFTVNGHTITFKSGDLPSVTGSANTLPAGYGESGNIATDGNGNSIVYLGSGATNSTATVGDVLNAIDLASGVQNPRINSTTAAATPPTPTGNTP